MEKKEKNKVLFIIILIVIALLFFVFLKNNIKNTKPIVINENIIIDTQKEESQKENINGNNNTSMTIGYDGDNINVLDSIEQELNENRLKQSQERLLREAEIKELIANYISDINADKDIIKYIDAGSIMKIKKNTGLIFNSLNIQEKNDFIKELKEYGFLQDSFNPDKNEDIIYYINFIVKAGAKIDGIITNFEFRQLRETSDFEIVDLILYYDNRKDLKKDLRLYINKNNKINISN